MATDLGEEILEASRMHSLPSNLHSLHSGEELLRQQGVMAIDTSETLSAHALTIESAMDLINYFCRHQTHADEDQLTIQLLGIRLFNGAASALKLVLAGYYQASALQQRDMLETAFLLDLFTHDRTLIAAWRNDSGARRFKPAAVRKVLDDRDGFTEKKREKTYKLFCELAGHPTHKGFRMLAPQPGGNAHCGPFFEVMALEAVLSELARLLVQASAAFTRFFKIEKPADCQTKIAFMEQSGRWFEKFYGRKFDAIQTAELRALLARMDGR